MNAEGKFWLGCWTLVATVLIALMIVIMVNLAHERNAAVDMVRAGATPQQAACALAIGQTQSNCVIANSQERPHESATIPAPDR